nr:selenite/tellurite reduction operon rhodanese-like protein ExtH [uncultured Desulfuromonas sp.]
MIRRVFKHAKDNFFLFLAITLSCFVLTACGGGGGGSDSYDEPDAQTTAPITGQIDNVLIEAPTLLGWMEAGLVNSDSFENVVIIQVNNYAVGHIPGAQEWTGARGIDRIDGPVLSGNMVLDGEAMDDAIQTAGIKAGSTVVLIPTGLPDTATDRAYLMFRYWGFPKEKIKVLNGGLAAWQAYGYDVTTAVTPVAASNFSVADLPGGPDFNARASLSEAIIGVSEATVVPYNTYANTSNVTTPTITETLDGSYNGEAGSSGYVIFQGLMLDAVTDNMLAGLKTTTTINGIDVPVLKSADEMRSYLVDDLGVDLTKTIMTYCRAGNLAASGFAPIDIVLGDEVDVMAYDGSWSQWGSLTNNPAVVPSEAYLLPNGYSDWATDVLTTDGSGGEPFYLYTANPETNIQQPFFFDAPASPYDEGANTIEDEDYDYWYYGGENGSAPTSGGSDASGGC